MTALAALELALTLALLVALLKGTKLHGFPAERGLVLDDLWVVALTAAVTVAPGLADLDVLRGLYLFALFVFFALMWLDSLLFRIFTIELGTGGLGTVVWSALYRELAELDQARRYLRENLAYAFFPVLVAAGLTRAIAPSSFALAASTTAVFALGTGLVLLRTSMTRTVGARVLWALSTSVSLAQLVTLRAGVAPDPAGAVLAAMLLALAAMKVAAWRLPAVRRREGFFGAFAFPRHFLGYGRLPAVQAVEPRPEHAAYLSDRTGVPPDSAEHGLLRGANVLLVTLESVGRAHLARSGGAAKTPFLDGWMSSGVTSRHHLCITPNTNEAHLALYASAHLAPGAVEDTSFSPTRALFDAGYTGVYLTAADTSDYGLGELVRAAGFSHVVERRDLAPGPHDGARPSDWALPTQGVEEVAAVLDARSGPFFLHVHTSNTHVPYRVVEPRFRRRDPAHDLDRFLDGIEETDAILAELFAALRARGLLDDTLVVVTSDHGQAFGELGYLSHASAVIAPEVDVPFVVHHARLAPRELALTTHLDVLPTILDLVGLRCPRPVRGRSVLAEPEPPCVLLSAGHPSRARASNFGLVVDDRKYMVDLVSGRCYELRWDDELVRELEGDERVYWTLLLHQILIQRGLS